MKLSFHQLQSLDNEFGRQALRIHEISFLPEQRIDLKGVAWGKDRQLHVLVADGQVATYSYTVLLGGGKVAFLVFLATDARLRGHGLGEAHLKRLREVIKLPLVLEADDPEHWGTKDQHATRRLAWYKRIGARDFEIRLEGINRVDPSAHRPVYRLLAFSRTGATHIKRATVHKAGLLILKEYYRFADDHGAVANFRRQF